MFNHPHFAEKKQLRGYEYSCLRSHYYKDLNRNLTLKPCSFHYPTFLDRRGNSDAAFDIFFRTRPDLHFMEEGDEATKQN